MGDFKHFLRQHGYEPPNDFASGVINRFGKNKNQWAIPFDDNKGGVVGDWRTGERLIWTPSGAPLTNEQKKVFAKQLEQEKQLQEQERKLRHQQASQKAFDVYLHAKPADSNHPYLVKKKIPPTWDLRQEGNQLIVPITNAQGDTWMSLQYIAPDSTKRFLTGGALKGGCYFIGLITPDKPTYVCEGFATGMSVHLLFDCAVVVAFSLGNLEAVATDLRKALPKNFDIGIAGDTDRQSTINKGKKEAERVAGLIEGFAIFPKFNPEDCLGTDFNDYWITKYA